MFKKFKEKAFEGAMKAMGDERLQKVIGSPEVQKVMTRALATGLRMRSDFEEARRNIVNRMNVATGDDLEDLKLKLDRLERKVRDLRDENETLREHLEDKDA